MENLSVETLKNKEEEKSGDKIIKKSSLLRRESTLDSNIDKRENLLKQSTVSKYSTSQLLIKSIKVSFLNWKYCLFVRTKNIFFDILDIYIPVQRGLIIDCITDKSKDDLLFPNFIRVVKFMIIKTIFEIIFQFIQINFINKSLYEYKDTYLN
mgnify:CR=1 FL=1